MSGGIHEICDSPSTHALAMPPIADLGTVPLEALTAAFDQNVMAASG
jgi:hypothetical protein